MKSRILSVIMLLLAVSTLAACHNGQSDDVSLINNPNSALGYDSTASVPHMVFDCNMHDFGRLTPGESISYSFHFVNKGTADLIIESCHASCGCTVADYPKEPIASGQEGYITVTFNSKGKSGQQMQEVTVSTNAQPAREVLKIIAQVSA